MLGPDVRSEGQVPFAVSHCPADIQIIHTMLDG